MAEGSSTVPDLETQKNEIANIAKKPLEKNDIWCLMDNKWFKQWKKYVGYDSWETSCVGDRATHPGPIDNSPLLKDDGSGEIKDHLIDELDYVLLPKEGWDLLSQWYGVIEGQNCISRKVVEYGMFVKHCKVEVYLLEFKLCQNHDMEHFVTQKFSKVDTIGYIEQEMRRIFSIPEEKETRLWNRYSTNTFEHLNTRESTVQDIGLYQGQVIIIEIRNDDGSWPRQVKNTSAAITYTSSPVSASGDNRQMYNNPTSTVSTRSFASVGGSGSYNSSNYNCDYTNSGSTFVHPGLCGLSNLGNTCFMNSALQCMSNTPLLTDYFLKDQYLNELNVENPLGMRGEIAKSYADLVKMIWSGRFAYTTPRHFKTMVGRFAPQFSGYQQQDCQELMAFLLDGLHEDLNRVKKKPYIELRDDDGRSDEIVSKEAWENYLKRNNSIIVDIFHGLLKSTLVCPQCSKVSVTFDPFCYLSLPLPLKKEKQQEIRFVPADSGRRPMNMKVTVPKHGCISDLCEAVSKTVGIPANNLIVTDVYSHRIHKIFDSGESLANITDRDKIYVYESPMNLDSCGNSLFLPVYLKEKRHKAGMTYGAGPSQLFGHPMFVLVHNKSCTYDDLYKTILNNMKRFAHNPSSEEDWEYIESIEEERMNGEVEMANGDDYDSDQADQGIEKDLPDDVHNVNKSDEFHLFNVQSVNSVGSVEVEKLSNDGSLLKLSNKTYLAVEFELKIKERFYDHQEAEAVDTHDSWNTRLSQKKQVMQLSECLELFTTTEKLGAGDPWYCPSCKKHQQATKKFDLWQLPKVLIIHLKRFSYNRYWRDKLDILVEFPVNGLNMAKYVINQGHGPAVYDLIAVANHYGGMGGGHYTAYAKNKALDSWYYFDDSSVTASSEDNVVSKAAYVLFYIRRDSLSTVHHSNRPTIPAALGAPQNNQNSSPDDNEGASSSDEDCSMDMN